MQAGGKQGGGGAEGGGEVLQDEEENVETGDGLDEGEISRGERGR